MAGAGVGTCIVCGVSPKNLVSDMCDDCHMAEFFAGLEQSALVAGDAVDLLRGGRRLWFRGLKVAQDYVGDWDGVVWVLYPHSDVPVHYRRSEVTKIP